jgi:hypothetical protein
MMMGLKSMLMAWRRSRSFWVLMFGVFVAGGIGVWLYNLPDPPVKELDAARIGIANAQKSHSGKYSAKLFNEAVVSYDSAMYLWSLENRRLFFLRNYDKVKELALSSKKKSSLAKDRSLNNIAGFKTRLKKRIKEVEKTLTLYDRNFSKIPIGTHLQKKLTKARMVFAEGKIAFEKKDYMASAPKIDGASADIDIVFSITKKQMVEYFNQYSNWVQLAEKAIADSRNNKGPAIVVDKFAGKCFLYVSGKLRFTWEAELGKNWIGDKKMMGDKATPEGLYHVVNKKAGRQTIYYKALLINYPNDDDKKRFSLAKKRGDLPNSAGIGNNIEIHGGGGKGVHWTDGCVALANADMDKIYREVRVGTPVTIVGSLKPFKEVFLLD